MAIEDCKKTIEMSISVINSDWFSWNKRLGYHLVIQYDKYYRIRFKKWFWIIISKCSNRRFFILTAIKCLLYFRPCAVRLAHQCMQNAIRFFVYLAQSPIKSTAKCMQNPIKSWLLLSQRLPLRRGPSNQPFILCELHWNMRFNSPKVLSNPRFTSRRAVRSALPSSLKRVESCRRSCRSGGGFDGVCRHDGAAWIHF